MASAERAVAMMSCPVCAVVVWTLVRRRRDAVYCTVTRAEPGLGGSAVRLTDVGDHDDEASPWHREDPRCDGTPSWSKTETASYEPRKPSMRSTMSRSDQACDS